jgi:hypothetical protein
MNPQTQLPAGTTLGKSFEYGIDVNLGTYDAPLWQAVRRMFGYQPADTETTQDAQTYDDLGSPNSDVTARGFGHSFNTQVNRSLATGRYLPEIEALLARTRPGAVGELAVIDYRWYHKPQFGTPNPEDAGRGFATVAKSRQNTGPGGEIEVLGWTLSGKGSYEEISNPFTGWNATAPLVASVTGPGGNIPTDNDLLSVTGSGLLGATAVTIEGAPVEFLPVSAVSLVAQLPVGDAGDVDIVVTTAGGASAPFTFTRGA